MNSDRLTLSLFNRPILCISSELFKIELINQDSEVFSKVNKQQGI